MDERDSPADDGTKSPGESGHRNRSKVARVIEEYGLSGLGDRLEREWLGEGERQRSLRELADRVNRGLLRAAVERAGMTPLDGEVENLYRLLTDDEVSSGARVEARNRLERNGVDPDRVVDDFVSHQAVYNYLTKHRGVEREDDDPDREQRLGRGTERIQRLRNRVASVTDGTVERLRDAGDVRIDEFDVLVDITVRCKGCGNGYEAVELLSEGGCACDLGEPVDDRGGSP